MTVPSYARATSTSLSRSNQQASRTNTPAARSQSSSSSPATTPKKLKRPSNLTSKSRTSLAYAASLIHIVPKDVTKPCPFTLLPSELREHIWSYALSTWRSSAEHPPRMHKKDRIYFGFPSLLHICRAIRIEAAYMYYTTQPFRLTVRNNNFAPVKMWLGLLPAQHRELLVKNRALRIDLEQGMRWSYTYPPRGWVLDDWTTRHWKACQPFGSLYDIQSERKRIDFILFCRLVSWFQLHSAPPYAGMKWQYRVVGDWRRDAREDEEMILFEFLDGQLRPLCARWEKVWVRRKDKGKGVEAAMDMLAQLEAAFCKCLKGSTGDQNWETVLAFGQTTSRIRAAIEKW